MTVRLYHDAMVAEVCSSQQIFRFKARYDYPNKSCINATKSIKLISFSGLVAILFSTWSDGDSGLLAS